MQAAFQRLMQSPTQVQRIMQLLSSTSTNGSAPISAPMTGPAQQSSSWPPPASLDLAQLAFYDSSIGGGNHNALTFDNKDAIGPSPMQIAEDQARLARTYNDAGEVDADVDVLQANINALIENMGLGSAALANSSAASTDPPPPLPSSEEMLPEQTVADFDFEAFLTAFANAQDNEGGATNADVIGDRASGSGSATGFDSAPGTRTNALSEQAVFAGRKRTSDVAELAFPLQEPSMISPSHVVPTERTDTTASDPPRVKRNKK